MTNSIKDFKPTYLYIKRHSITKKLYFGKTIRKDVEYYNGSGSRWNNHIAHHSKEFVETVWYCLFYDEDSIKEFALMCSEQWQIVDSDEWLNLIPENGTTGAKPDTQSGMTGKTHSEATKEKLRQANLGLKHSEETKKKMSGKGHVQTLETIEKIKQKQTGVKRGPAEIVICAHCNESGGLNNMVRFHFDNCGKVDGPMNGKTHSNETKEKCRIASLGKVQSDETRKKKSDKLKGCARGKQEMLTCPHCKLLGGSAAMKRYHFDECKFKV